MAPDGGDEQTLNQEMAGEAGSMLTGGFIEGLDRQLRSKFPTVAGEADAAVGHAVHQLITRPSSPDKPRSYVAACAYNEMKRYARLAARSDSLDALRDPDRTGRRDVISADWSVEETALIDEVYVEFCRHVQTWETGNVRSVTLLYLEAARNGEPLPSDEAAQQLGEILGEEVDPDFVRTWKSRGFKRLRDWVAEQTTSEGDNHAR